jgi:hypothetical protein
MLELQLTNPFILVTCAFLAGIFASQVCYMAYGCTKKYAYFHDFASSSSCDCTISH